MADKKNKYGALKAMAIILLSVLLAASLLLNLFTFVISVVRYYGNSMSPTLSDGQILVVNRLSEVKSGDVVAFYYNNKVLVRRVIATGDQQVSVDLFGKVSVDGTPLEEPYVTAPTLGQSNTEYPYNVPADNYFVMGDNRALAMDSRLQEIGTVTEDRMIGKVIFVMG